MSFINTQNWYTQIASIYDPICGPLYAAPRRYAVQQMALQGGERVVEIGCGTGLNLPALVQGVGTQGRILGVDCTSAMLRRAEAKKSKRGWGQVELRPWNLLELSEETIHRGCRAALGVAQADIVLASYVFAIAPRWRDLFHRSWCLLRPGGLFVMVDTRPLQGIWRWGNPLLVPVANWSGHGQIRRPTWRLLANAPGFQLQSFWGGFVFVATARKALDGGRP